MRQTRILSLLLSLMMVFSICAAPISAVFAEVSESGNTETAGEAVTENLASSNTETAGEAAAENEASSDAVTDGLASPEVFAESAVDFAKKDDTESTDSIGKSRLVISVIRLISSVKGREESASQTKELLNKLTTLDQKIDTYHSELVVMLKDMNIKNEIRDYDITMKQLFARRDRIHTALKSKNEDELIKKMSEGSSAAKDELINYYKTIIARCNEVDLLNKYDDAIALVTKRSTSTQKAFEGAYDLMANKTDDADQLAQSYKKYIYSQMAELGMAYMDVAIYWNAKIKLKELDSQSVPETDLKDQLKLAHTKLRGLVETEIKAAKDRYDGINQATVESVKSDGTKAAVNYTNFAVAWKAAINEMKKGSTVTFTLNQDWLANNQTGFVDKSLFTDTQRKDCFTQTGEMLIPGGTLTINLNGHKISAGGNNLTLFQVAQGANLTINGTGKKEQGLSDGKSAITYEGGFNGQVTINLNNVWMKNFKSYTIDAGNMTKDTSDIHLNYNGGGIENSKNSAIRLRGSVYFKISNCEFNHNFTAGYGAALCCNDIRQNLTGSIQGCTFNNNTSANDGGAIYGPKEASRMKIEIEGCTFNKNSAKNDGGAVEYIWSIKNCQFIENSAGKCGGAAANLLGSSIDSCNFTGNESNGSGGAVFYEEDANIVSIINSTFTNNRSKTGNSGAIWAARLAIDRCTFEKNSAKLNGGAVTARGWSITVKGSTFNGNTAENCGGAIFTQDCCEAIIEGSQFTGNSAKVDGGALYLTPLKAHNHALNNVTITGNTAGNGGGGIYCSKSGMKCGDCEVKGKVVIDGNTGGKNLQSNVLLQQAGGVKKCILYAGGLDTANSKIGISTDCKNKLTVVSNAANRNPFYGDNNREILGSSGDLQIKSLNGGCKK